MRAHSIVILSLILLSFSAHAKVFRNAYISFEMPESWNCNLEQTEWVCRSEQNKESKEAIIILTAKEVGPTDSFSLYEAHLNAPIALPLRGGGTAESKVIYKTKSVQINDQAWIDSLHLGSEVPNYFTRYLSTIKEKIAILITFSAHKDFYTKYSQDFFRAVMSLRVIASKNILARPDVSPGAGSFGSLGDPNLGAQIAGLPGVDAPAPKQDKNKKFLLGAGIILAALAAFIFLRARRKR